MCSRGYKLPGQVDPVGNYDFVVLYYCVPHYQHSLPGYVVGSLGNCWELRGISIFSWRCCSNLDSIGCVFRGWNCWRKFCSSRICLFGGRRFYTKLNCSGLFYSSTFSYPKPILGGWGFYTKFSCNRLFYSSTFSYPKPILASWGFCTKLNS